MVRVREHVQRLHPDQVVGFRGEVFEVARQRRWVAGDVGDLAGAELRQRVERAGVAARPGRVEDERVGRCIELRQRVLRLRLHQPDVVQALHVLPRVRHRRRRLLDRDDFLHVRYQQRGEDADSGVSVHQHLAGLQVEALPHQPHQTLRLPYVHLEERGRGDPEPPSQKLLLVVRLT